jgi:hypothetical protein
MEYQRNLADPRLVNTHRSTLHNSHIVHQANQISIAYHGTDFLGSFMYSVGVGNVHHERHEAVTELALLTIGVSLLAYRTEHAKFLRNKHLCGFPADSGRDPGDHDIFAVRLRISPKMMSFEKPTRNLQTDSDCEPARANWVPRSVSFQIPVGSRLLWNDTIRTQWPTIHFGTRRITA